ncbi:MAG: hypothetical protein ACRC6M_06460 [Microcystaceae cyanobacterium]
MFSISKPVQNLKRYLSEYQPQLEKALSSIKILESYDPNSEEFTDALAQLHTGATILESYSQGVIEAIDNFTDQNYADETD